MMGQEFGAAEGLPDPRTLDQLPPELVQLLADAAGNGLHELSQAALQPTFTSRILTCLEPIFPGLAARWMPLDPSLYSVQIVSALSRVLPVAPYLRSFALIYLERHKQNLPFFSDAEPSGPRGIADETLREWLLALFRLLSFDLDAFSTHVSPIQLRSLFTHDNGVIRYLSIRCFGLYMHAADAVMEDLLSKYIGNDSIPGEWEGLSIDYRYLGLSEEKRWKTLKAELDASRKAHIHSAFLPWIKQAQHTDYVAEVGDVLVPTARRDRSTEFGLVKCPTTMDNLGRLAYGLLSLDPILLVGPAGSGKTSCVIHAAQKMGYASSMITLHLNEQTDSKSLLGVYSTSPESGGFAWQPGVLTKAAQEGRWVLIEDLDRTPSEVMGLILPLIENRELVIPSRKEHIRCAEGFRVIATMRSSLNLRQEEVTPGRSILGSRLWRRVRVAILPFPEVKELIHEEFPLISLTRFVDVFHNLYRRMDSVVNSSVAVPASQGRGLGLRDLMKFCRRIERRLKLIGVETGMETVPERTVDEVFLDAVDCFAAYIPNESLKLTLIGAIAEELNMSPQRMHFSLSDRVPIYSDESNSATIGREECPKVNPSIGKRPGSLAGKQSPFAATKISLRTMEQVAAGLQASEPMLLVGETGIGKTAVVQQLATLLRQRLTVVNLSQQSETTDLLGGYKPVSLRSIAVTMVDEFTSLFESTFSARKNQKFLSSVSKSVANGNWLRLTNILKEAVKMSSGVFDIGERLDDEQGSVESEQPSKKKRKLNSSKYSALRRRWESFAGELGQFEARVSQEDSKLSLAFVQGKIVKALRNGEWVLLDEINLASPDTLESIASLLDDARDGGPSVLLSEAGDVERVFGHPNFRIFGAMNPATDAGKKDLAPALRSRFTELYVQSPDNEVDDLLGLIEAYLGPLVNHDRMASSALANLYLETKRLSAGNKLVDGAGQKPHFSVRTLVRTLLYVTDQAHVYGLRRAIYEGFCMSFLTLLSKDSERQVIPLLDKHIFGNVRNSRSILSQTPREPSDGNAHVQFKHYWMRRGNSNPEMQPHYILTPFIERNLLNLVRAGSTRRFPILLQGPTSSGKTSMVEYLAKLSGNRFVRINNHEHTDLQEYLGSYVSGEDGRLRYQEGILVEALRNGYWIVLDELNLAPTDVLEALNRLLDDNRELFLPETQEIVRPHQNFMLFATQNPAGLYGGRKVLSRAFRNRFLELHFDDIPEDELEFILKERSQIAPSFCTNIVSVYRQLALLRQSSRLFEQRNSFATLRDLFRWAHRRADDREQLAINGFMLLGERVRNPQEREAVKHVIEKTMRVKIDEKSIYSSRGLESRLRRLDAVGPAGIVWTQAMRRLFILVSEAIEHNEPVLLVGETGCGKTQLCQAVAEAYGRDLSVVNAHINLETGDLIGAQRPVRNRAAIEQQVLDDVAQLLRESGASYGKDIAMDDAKSALDALPPEGLETCNKSVLERVRNNLTRAKALFEWSDGSLVEAMKSGQFFLLDELSLADDSVLERLNSVLEPQRSLLLAEKGPVDSSVVAKDGFQFLSTMNPGGDYGKRELSAALRNRLTEIWVPPLSEAEDILPIVESKFERSLPRAPVAMLEFAKWFKERSGGPGSAVMSIRDLLAWTSFVNTCRSLSTPSAIVHGACMVYIDSVGANPSAMLATGRESLDKDRVVCLEKLGHLFELDAQSIYSRPIDIAIDSGEMTIGPFRIAGGPQGQQDPNFALETPTTLANTLRIARGLQSNKPILIEGSPGVGKTTLVAALAGVLGKPLTRINLSEQTDLTDLFGSDVPVEGGDVGSFAWSDAPFLRAMQRGGWVLLDEMNLASQSVLEGLNSCLDHRQQVYIAELDQTFTRHPDFVLFAAQNPHHQGGGRKGLPTSFVNRFTVVYADSYTARDLQLICRKISPETSSDRIERLVDFISSSNAQLADRCLGATGGPWEINLRDLSRWFKLQDSSSGDVPPWQFLDVVISQRFRTEEDRTLITKLYTEIFGESPGSKSYYHNLGPTVYQIGLGRLLRDSVIQHYPDTQAMIGAKDLPMLESLMLCLERAWPAVLVGPSGCGKTSTLRKLATLAGAKLVGLALNSDTDAMDLVGGFEQRDIQRQISIFVRDLCAYLRQHILPGYNESQVPDTVDHCLQLYQELSAGRFQVQRILEFLGSMFQTHQDNRLSEFYETCKSLYRMSLETYKVGFEWTDGLLVDAIQRGDWVVLDNANLCDSSVLDRLNSLLEPDGCLIVNEQRTSDGSARVVKPHPNFRLFLTMDPRFGELSRAMRNRAVEIFFLHQHDSDSPRNPPIAYTWESSLYRLRQLQNLNWSQTPTEFRSDVVATSLDHLGEKDVSKAGDFLASVVNGLPSEGDKSVASSTIRHYTSLIANRDLVGWHNLVSNKHANEDYRDSDCQQVIEPLHPLVNEPRLLTTSMSGVDSLAVRIAELQEHQLNVLQLREALSNAEISARAKKPSEMNPIELSTVSTTLPPHMRKLTRPFAPFLFGCSDELAGFIRSQTSASLHRDVPPLLDTILQFCWDIFRISQSRNFDEPEFQAYVQTGMSLLSPSQGSAMDLISRILQLLDTLRSGWSLTTGLSMQRLWEAWRPATASNIERLNLQSELREICTQFDQVFLKTRLSHSHLGHLRRSLIATQFSVLHGASANDLVSDLALQINDAKSHTEDIRPPPSPYLPEEFEALCQYHDLTSPDVAEQEPFSELLRTLELFAGRPSLPDDVSPSGNPIPSLLSSISRFSGFKSLTPQALAVRGNICLSLLEKLSSLADVSLNQRDLVTSEVSAISRGLAWSTKPLSVDQIALLRSKISYILEQLLICHEDQFDPKLFQVILSFIRHPDNAKVQTQWLQEQCGPENGSTARSMLVDTFIRSLDSIAMEPGRRDGEDCFKTGEACMALALTCLRLFVPDRPFDPSLGLVVERQRYIHRVSAASRKLEGLKFYEKYSTGRCSNLRIAVAEHNLGRLGSEPPQPPVIRPVDSQLNGLQMEFGNILSSVLNRSFEDIVTSAKEMGSADDVDGGLERCNNLLQTNIRQICLRLTKGHNGYEDIAIPVVRFLQLLDLGMSLVQQSQIKLSEQQSLIDEFSKGVPLLDGTGKTISEVGGNAFPGRKLVAIDVGIHRLSRLGVAQNTNPDTLSKAKYRSTLRETISKLYGIWKDQVEQDQTREAEKSRLYHYKFSSQDQLSEAPDGILQMFPTFEEESDQNSVQSSKVDPRILSLKLSQFIKDLFTAKDKELVIQRLIMNSGVLIGKTISGAPRTVVPTEPKALLPAVFFQLDDVGAASSPELYNFYADPNTTEAKKLVQLVERVLQKFTFIQKSWPEHATVGDVIACCLQILQFKHSEPVAKFITKTEQLHTFVYEWQSVASRQFSVVDCYNDLTTLIITWRKLELSTWARLLDLEKERCETDANGWWFVVYEIIIAGPLQMVENGCERDMRSNIVELVNALQKFVQTTPMGQFAFRLKLIERFKLLLDIYAVDFPALGCISGALSNLVRHNAPFVPMIESELNQGRQSLEKEIQQEIQLCSWKDVNIAALRESARRSHNKLFKVVRKYRGLLDHPCDNLLAKGYSNQAYQEEPITRPPIRVPKAVPSNTLSLCRDNALWRAKPARFQDPNNTVENMRQMYRISLGDFQAAEQMDLFVRDVLETIKSFKAMTPKTLTEENNEEAQHLKVQKRRFYADKLRDLRHMGIQSNLGTDALSKQSSVESVLATTASLPPSGQFSQIDSANSYFHRLLDLLPRVRVAGRKYAEDLSNVEAGRSAGFVEGLLFRVLRQREKLRSSLESWTLLDTVVAQMANVSSLPSGELRTNTSATSTNQELQGTLRWLEALLGVCGQVLKIQLKFAASGPSDVLDKLAAVKSRCSEVLSLLETAVSLPPGLSSGADDSHICQAQYFLETTKSDLLQLIEEYPEFAFALEPLLPWTETDILPGLPDYHDGSTSCFTETFDSSITSAVDKIFVAIQRLKSYLPTVAPASIEDQEWLTKADHSLSHGLDELHMKDISTSIKSAFEEQSLAPTEKNAFTLGQAAIAVLLPIVQQYQSICFDMLHRHASLHKELCKMGYLLANSFIQIASEGFCSPAEASDEPAKSDKLEGGTGLGEGGGAEDISKDVQDDEDLTDLAQQKNELNDEQSQMEEAEDAVNMDNEDLEADDKEDKAEDKQNDDDKGSDGEREEEDLDEEVGSVDGLDSTAVDEKLWDGADDKDLKDTENKEGKGSSTDDKTAASEKKTEEGAKEEESREDEIEELEAEDEGEAVGREDVDAMDPHAKDEQVLDLPEDIQLDGQDKGENSDKDEELDDLSMADKDELDNQPNEEDGGAEDNGPESLPEDTEMQDDNAEESGVAVEDGDKHEQDLDMNDGGNQEELLKERGDEAFDSENLAPSEVVSGVDQHQGEDNSAREDTTHDQASTKQNEGIDQEDSAAATGSGGQKRERKEEGGGVADGVEDSQTQAFKKLGDILEEWHRRHRNIQEASSNEKSQEANQVRSQESQDVDMENTEFQHLADEEDVPDTQALGQAEEEQARGLDQSRAVESDAKPKEDDILWNTEETDDAAAETNTLEDQMQVEQSESSHKQHQQSSFFIANEGREGPLPPEDSGQNKDLEELDNVDGDLSAIHLSTESGPLTPADEARRLWSHYESVTHELSLSLTEQLRLILAPTMATKLRGDFRTGKRLNIKRIIPYIASQYKRDKIWMRRSIPSKRSYQIMLAVDDSKSMLENGSGQLAFETLALVSKSLSMLEAGDLCIVGFGNEEHIRVAHEFGKPFSSEAGMRIFQQFSYKQTGTNVRKLVTDAIALFREARATQSSASRMGDLWQLQLIISDGICEDHDVIRRLVRQAQEERIMIVFIIVDAVADESRSIMNLTQASFEPDESGTGDGKWKMKRYLDNFPFPYYLVVRDVQELPGVLSLALKQWFAEVVEISA